MIRHLLFTGEIGIGKSTVLTQTLARVGADARGLQTYSPEPRGILPKHLFLRPYGSREEGTLLCVLPDGDQSRIAPIFDSLAAQWLEEAEQKAQVIVVDEIGRLEREARRYHAVLRACLEGKRPVVGVIRKHKAPWAEWIRTHPDVLVLEVTQENRNTMAETAAAYIRAALDRE